MVSFKYNCISEPMVLSLIKYGRPVQCSDFFLSSKNLNFRIEKKISKIVNGF